MPTNLVQQASGGFNATGAQTVALGAATTAGNTAILVVFTYGGGAVATPTGFTRDSPAVATSQKGYIFRKSNIGAGESWSLSVNLAQPVAWTAFEYEAMEVATSPVDVASPWTTATAATASTGTSATSTAYDTLAIGFVGVRDAASGTPPTWTGHTNGFAEIAAQGQAIAAGTSSVGLSVATKAGASLVTWEFTATHSLSPATAAVGGNVVVYAAAGSKWAANIIAHAGFEWGTAAGITTGLGPGSVLFDASAGSPAVVATNPRTGNHCLELSAAAATEYVQWSSTTLGNLATMVVRGSVLFPSSLPAGDVNLVQLGSTNNVFFRFRASSSQLGVQAGTGTEQLSATTVVPDTWYSVDLRASTSTTAPEACDWQLDGIDQTAAVGAVNGSSSFTGLFVGWTVAATATVRYDDLAVSDIPGNYPIGDIKVVLLKVDPAGTPSVSGTVGNFGVMTANGTVVALTTPTLGDARDAVDDWPPTIGASADGAVANASSATDYIEFPMETYNASGTASIRAVRVLLPMWAASATAATCRILGYDGTTATTLFAEADPNADNSTTTPAWIAKQWKPTGGWTQAKLDAATIRFGAADASPKLGPHAVGIEVAVQVALTVTLFGGPDDPLRVEQALDPVTQGIVALVAYTPADQGATLTYEVDEVEQTPVVLDPGTDGLQIPLDAPDMPTISRVTLTPAEPS